MEAKFFKEIPFFSNLSEENVKKVMGAFKARRFVKGDVIVSQGDPGDGFYVIVFGEAHVIRDGEKIAALGTNDFFGEMSLIAAEPRSATVRVISDNLSVFFLGKNTFDEIKKELGADVKKEILKRIQENFAKEEK